MKEKSLTELNAEYIQSIKEHLKENTKSSQAYYNYIENSTAKYHGEPVYALYMPKLLSREAAAYLKEAAETMYSILAKVIERYLADEEYRKQFGFDPELEELILVPRQYTCPLPVARVDIFLNEKDMSFQFCEFNTDGTSSMNEDRELNLALRETAVYKEMSQKYKISTFELFDSWVCQFISIYQTYKKKVDHPYIAIVDFLEKGSSMEEFDQFKKSFQRAGYEAEICEITKLRYEKGSLYSPTGHKIHAIYRRAVTCDIMAQKEDVWDFLEAVKGQAVCLIGSFCTQVAHNKILFKLLHEEDTQRILTEKEREFIRLHIPATALLNRENVEKYKVLSEKDKYIIKPEDSYGARGVYAGIHFSPEEWEKKIEDHVNKDYLVQEFYTPYQTDNIDFLKKKPEFLPYSNLTGLYVYNGTFHGVYSRQSKKEIISTVYDENVVATVILED